MQLFQTVHELSSVDFFYCFYRQKELPGKTALEICPANLTEEQDETLRRAAEAVYRGLNLKVYCRADFILDKDGKAWFLEVNTLPGMTPNSLIPKAAKVEGLSYDELCEKIVQLSVREVRDGFGLFTNS